ncbi:ABC transporter substrate-binding protein [Syntrophomonas erecta]
MSRGKHLVRLSRLLMLFVLPVVVSLLLVSCGGQSDHTAPVADKSQNTITVVDSVGREVVVPANTERIACLCPESGHAMVMYGKGDNIVAAVGGMQRDLLLLKMHPHIKDVPVPKSSGVINIETLATCKPDLVFVKGDTVNNEAEIHKLNKAGIPFLTVEFNSIKDQQQVMAMIGKTVGSEAKAARYNQYYNDCIERVQQRVKDIPAEKRVRIYHSLNEATRTDSLGTLPADIMEAAWVIDVSVQEQLKVMDGKHFASLEQIMLWDPDYILCNDYNVVGYIRDHEQWAPLKAVKNNRVLALPNGVSRWAHQSSLETPLAVMWIAKTIYPHLFTDLDMEKETRYFYKEFFNWDLDNETIQNILNGQGMRAPKQ